MQEKNKQILFSALLFLAGAAAGLASGWFSAAPSDGTTLHTLFQVLGKVLSQTAFWVFIGCVIAYYSRNPVRAAAHVLCFFAGLLISTAVYGALLSHNLTLPQLLRWAILVLCGAAAGYMVWHAGNQGWLPALCAAVPIGYLIAQGYQVYRTYRVEDMADLVMAAALYVMLPRSKTQRLRVLPLMLLAAFLIVRSDLVVWLFSEL